MSKTQRKLPLWMYKKAAVVRAISSIVSTNENNKNTQNSLDDDEPPARRTRSNSTISDDDKPKSTAIHSVVEDFPLVEYTGKIHYLTDFISIAESLELLIKKVDEMSINEKDVPVAFDMEWTFSFKTGPEKTALIQICLDISECYLFQLSGLKKLPASLSVFLAHPRVRLHGVNIKNDLRKLERDFPLIKTEKMIERCIELGTMYNEVFNSSGRWSMERLVHQTLRLQIDKSRHVRMSKWHIIPLSDHQKLYAAIDVFIAQKIYYYIKQKKDIEEQDWKGFFGSEDKNSSPVLTRKSLVSSEIDKLLQNC